MGVINHLPEEVIAHIAAGQVVERPVSIVKELLENAIDARAKNIVIRIEDGGKKSIVVSDDGVGMELTDLLLSIEPHTTSKIKNLEDLQNLHTFGFRGEALASIARAAVVQLQSRPKTENIGTKITANKGTITEQEPVGMAMGTTVSVEDLFADIPARKKFLKSAALEFQYILDVVTQIALAYPKISFQIYHNQKLISDFLPVKSLEERSQTIFGKNLEKLFLPLKISTDSYKISGFIGTPQAAAQISQRQILLINKRPVTHLPISKIVKRTFGSLLPPQVHPPFILELELDPSTVDVNTHPRKERIALSEQEMLLEILSQAVREALTQANLLFEYEKENDFVFNDSGMDEGTAEELRDKLEPWNVKNYFLDEPILQVKKLYLVAQTKQGLLLIDQHAAHERILYEEFLTVFQKEKKQSSNLEKPVTLELPILEAQVLQDTKDFFGELGFQFTQTSPTHFSFTSLPTLLKTRPLAEYFLEVLKDVYEGIPVTDLDLESHRTIAYLACRTAIKAGEVLTQEERKNLLSKLLSTTSKYTCPHGRPVMVRMQLKELAQLFHRIPASRNEKYSSFVTIK